MSTGIKFDQKKIRYSLIPPGTLQSVVQVLEFGANKYAPDNWMKVPEARTRYYDAGMRHIEAWWAGEKVDPETGQHPLAHAVCCLLFLIWFDQHAQTVENIATRSDSDDLGETIHQFHKHMNCPGHEWHPYSYLPPNAVKCWKCGLTKQK